MSMISGPLLYTDVLQKSEVGGCPNREILMGSGCVIPSLGLWTSISPPGGVRRALALGVVGV